MLFSNRGKTPGTPVQHALALGTRGAEFRHFLASDCGTTWDDTKSARGFAPLTILGKRGKSPGTQVQHTLVIGTRGTEFGHFLAPNHGTIWTCVKSARTFAPLTTFGNRGKTPGTPVQHALALGTRGAGFRHFLASDYGTTWDD